MINKKKNERGKMKMGPHGRRKDGPRTKPLSLSGHCWPLIIISDSNTSELTTSDLI